MGESGGDLGGVAAAGALPPRYESCERLALINDLAKASGAAAGAFPLPPGAAAAGAAASSPSGRAVTKWTRLPLRLAELSTRTSPTRSAGTASPLFSVFTAAATSIVGGRFGGAAAAVDGAFAAAGAGTTSYVPSESGRSDARRPPLPWRPSSSAAACGKETPLQRPVGRW